MWHSIFTILVHFPCKTWTHVRHATYIHAVVYSTPCLSFPPSCMFASCDLRNCIYPLSCLDSPCYLPCLKPPRHCVWYGVLVFGWWHSKSDGFHLFSFHSCGCSFPVSFRSFRLVCLWFFFACPFPFRGQFLAFPFSSLLCLGPAWCILSGQSAVHFSVQISAASPCTKLSHTVFTSKLCLWVVELQACIPFSDPFLPFRFPSNPSFLLLAFFRPFLA